MIPCATFVQSLDTAVRKYRERIFNIKECKLLVLGSFPIKTSVSENSPVSYSFDKSDIHVFVSWGLLLNFILTITIDENSPHGRIMASKSKAVYDSKQKMVTFRRWYNKVGLVYKERIK